jgi:hypothetical protein
MPAPSRASRLRTEAVHRGHCSTSLKTSHTVDAGASTSMLLSVIMYQTVHRTDVDDEHEQWNHRGVVTRGAPRVFPTLRYRSALVARRNVTYG